MDWGKQSERGEVGWGLGALGWLAVSRNYYQVVSRDGGGKDIHRFLFSGNMNIFAVWGSVRCNDIAI